MPTEGLAKRLGPGREKNLPQGAFPDVAHHVAAVRVPATRRDVTAGQHGKANFEFIAISKARRVVFGRSQPVKLGFTQESQPGERGKDVIGCQAALLRIDDRIRIDLQTLTQRP